MSAIAGFWRRTGDGAAIDTCRHMLDRLRPYGSHIVECAGDAAFAAGKCHRETGSTADEDRLPITSGDGRYMLIADARVDNREELALLLGIGSGGGNIADSRLLLEGFRRFGPAVLQQILGDFAFAAWDRRAQTLFLARDPFGEKPLHFAQRADFVTFASMPGAIGPEVRAEVDEERLAELVGDLWPRDGRSYFRNVERVQPGQWILFGENRRDSGFYWQPPTATLRLPTLNDYADAMREQLDAAVARRLRRSGGAVGAHLSSGYDSSAVASSAALALGNETLYAFTSAPREGFAGPVPRGWSADESGTAAATARLHANMRHIVVRAAPGSPAADLARAHRLAGQPTGGVMNGGLWTAINDAAQARGVTVMLTGEVGNFTLSAGLGTDQLHDLLREGRAGPWWREANALAASEYGWLTVINASLGRMLPSSLRKVLRRAVGREAEPASPICFVAPRHRAAVAAEEARSGMAASPWRRARDRRLHHLRGFDPGNYRKRSLAQWGIEERDVTADRRLVEFCLSLPVEALLRNGERRPALRRTLAGRVAPQVLAPSPRGYQSADWFERIGREQLLAWVEDVDREPARRVVDFAEVRRVAATWPGEALASQRTIALYPMSLLRALSAAQFANEMPGLLDER